MNVIWETFYFFTTLRKLTPDGGVSISTSRTSRRFMNIHYGNHGNEMSRKAVLSIFDCHDATQPYDSFRFHGFRNEYS